jgi:HEAT repeat protein
LKKAADIIPAKASVSQLREFLKHDNPDVQAEAAAQLADRGPEAAPAVLALARLLEDSKVPEVRRKAALALGRIGTEARPAVPALVEALAPGVPTEVRQHAAQALALIAFPHIQEALPALREAIKNDKDPRVRHLCAEALFKDRDLAADARTLEALAAVLEEKGGGEEALVRYDAARLLAHVLGPKAPDRTIDVLMEMLQNRTLRVFDPSAARVEPKLGGDARYMAAQALGWLKGKLKKRPDALAALKAAEKDPDPEVKKAANEALATLAALGIK